MSIDRRMTSSHFNQPTDSTHTKSACLQASPKLALRPIVNAVLRHFCRRSRTGNEIKRYKATKEPQAMKRPEWWYVDRYAYVRYQDTLSANQNIPCPGCIRKHHMSKSVQNTPWHSKCFIVLGSVNFALMNYLFVFFIYDRVLPGCRLALTFGTIYKFPAALKAKGVSHANLKPV